ncbi:MAG: DUF4280 domain-containing protein [Paludibacteraceae bacterium]|nr:DUF4280 domain-containing protein [Paludibacteraceae bacterium]
MSEEYTVEGAMAKCNQSKVPVIAKLSNILDNQYSKTNGKTAATTMTLGPAFGVQPFGICNMIPPTPAVPTPPCVCMVVSWSGGYTGQKIGMLGANPLTSDSKATCALGGSIEFVTSGQLPKACFFSVPSAVGSNINTVFEGALDEKVKMKLPSNVDPTNIEDFLSLDTGKNIQYHAFVAMYLFSINKNNPEKYDAEKSKDRREKSEKKRIDAYNKKHSEDQKEFDKDNIKMYESAIQEFVGEYKQYYRGGKSPKNTYKSLIAFEKAIIEKKLTVTNISVVLAGLEVQSPTQIGEEWVLRNLAQDADSGSTIEFESYVETDNGDRYVDVVVEKKPHKKKHIEYKSVKDVPPSHFTEQFSKDMQSSNNNTKCKVQWKFDGDKLASEYKKSHTDAWEGNKKWSELNEGEKEAVRADFRGKMRNGTDNPKRDGLNKVEMDEDLKDKLMANDKKGNAKFDSIFIIA